MMMGIIFAFYSNRLWDNTPEMGLRDIFRYEATFCSKYR